MQIDLDAASPKEFPKLLRKTAQDFRESTGELQASWGDQEAGKIWLDFAAVLERAARSADTMLGKRGF